LDCASLKLFLRYVV